MSAATFLPEAHARQWLRLRQLRVQRARQALAQALAAESAARLAVGERQALIDASRERLTALAHHWGGTGSVDLPRWGDQLAAHRASLDERLERDEYALLDEQEALDEARTAVQQRRVELARAQAREDAVDATLQTQRRALAGAREQQAELDVEDARRAAHGEKA